MFKYFIVFIFCAFLSSCYYNNEEELYGIYECGDNIPSYNEEVDAIITQNCSSGIGCHNEEGHHPKLLTLEQRQDRSIAMLKRIQNGTMPKGSYFLTEEEKLKIYCWINAGSPDN